ncbi:hypothetical protein Tco_0206183 [Tanacetum coccineum]
MHHSRNVLHHQSEAQKPCKRLKRVAGSYAIQKSPKKSKVLKYKEEAAEYVKEKEELMLSLKIISNDDSKVNYEPLSIKFPILEAKEESTMAFEHIKFIKSLLEE